MFGFGWSEFVLLFGLVLVVLGPDRMPGLVRTIGRLAGRARSMARQFTERLDREAAELQSAVDLNDAQARSKDSPPSGAPNRQHTQGQDKPELQPHEGMSVQVDESNANLNRDQPHRDRP